MKLTISKLLTMSFMKASPYINKRTGKPDYNVIGWWIEEKFDGQRAQWDSEVKRLKSRYGNVVSSPEWFNIEIENLAGKYPLDGELFMGYKSWELTGIFRAKTKAAEIANMSAWKCVKYMVFDIADLTIGNYDDRYKILTELFSKYPNISNAILVNRTKVTDKAMIDEYYKRILERGGEGIILINPHTFYVNGLTSNLLKYKPVLDNECIVIGYHPGKGRNLGKLGSFIVHPIEDGEPNPKLEFKISGINDVIRTNYKKTHPIGCVLSYRFTEVTKKGLPRHPFYIGICKKSDRLRASPDLSKYTVKGGDPPLLFIEDEEPVDFLNVVYKPPSPFRDESPVPPQEPLPKAPIRIKPKLKVILKIQS